eukprot:TRINITY_DN447_c0_g1_i1.p1 TRINITY_DN447_c0_g1~~TRINITY_DN447_c0_g1_i1.p1  ORF type:complete len:327 (-),score=41.13 TRINITY_DN447_c0_g1_i1:29-886(-)
MATYYPLSILSLPIWQNRAPSLTIKFPSYFIILTSQLKMLLSLLVSFFSDNTTLYLTVNLLFALLLLFLVATVRSPHLSPLNPHFKTMWNVKVARVGSYVATLLGALAAIAVNFINDEDISIIVIVIMFVVDLIIGCICGIVIMKGPRIDEATVQQALEKYEKKETIDKVEENEDKVDDNEAGGREMNVMTKSTSARGICTRCRLRPVQAVVRRDNVEMAVCRYCVSARAKSLKATMSEMNLIQSGLRERHSARSGIFATQQQQQQQQNAEEPVDDNEQPPPPPE